MTGNRADALARLDVFVGGWSMEAQFPGHQPAPSGAAGRGAMARSRFEWALGGQFLLQHTEIPIPQAPDSLAIVGTDLRTGGYTQHYYDSRGVVRLYVMGFAGGVWTLTRESPDFSPRPRRANVRDIIRASRYYALTTAAVILSSANASTSRGGVHEALSPLGLGRTHSRVGPMTAACGPTIAPG